MADTSTFVCTLKDQNGKLLTGKTVQILEHQYQQTTFNLTESTARPGTYYNTAVTCGLEYDVTVDGSILPEWSGIPFGSGVGRDDVFLNEHTASGQHGEVTVTKITFY